MSFTDISPHCQSITMEMFSLTESSCLEILENCGIDVSKIMKYKFNLNDTLCEELSSRGHIFRVYIEYEKDSLPPENLTVLIKSPISTPAHPRDTGLYDNEYILYSEVFPEIAKLSKDVFVPRFLGGNRELPVIAMEDLYSKGYQSKTTHYLCYKTMFKYMAKMHALSAVLDRTTPISDELNSDNWDPRSFYNRGINRLIDKLSDDIKAKYAEQIQLLKDTGADKIIAMNQDVFKTLIHGNLWYPNILFYRHKKQRETQSVAFINFEQARWDNPVYDIWFLIVNDVSYLYYAHKLDSLLEAYIDTMNDIFKAHGMDVYSFTEFKKIFYRNCLYALCVCGAVSVACGTDSESRKKCQRREYPITKMCSYWFDFFARKGFFEKGKFPKVW